MSEYKMYKAELKLTNKTPMQVINGKQVPQVNSDGEPIVLHFYNLNVILLGKKKSFGMHAKDKGMKQMMFDFFDLQGVDILPVVVKKNSMIDKETGQVTEFYQTLLRLEEKDEIHEIEIAPSEEDKKAFQMWQKELFANYVPSEKILKARKDRYDSLKKEEEAEKVSNKKK